MTTWLTAKKAAEHLKENNPKSMIGERTLQNLIKQGFPCLKVNSRTLINVSTFESDLEEFVNAQLEKSKNESRPKIRRIKV